MFRGGTDDTSQESSYQRFGQRSSNRSPAVGFGGPHRSNRAQDDHYRSRIPPGDERPVELGTMGTRRRTGRGELDNSRQTKESRGAREGGDHGVTRAPDFPGRRH